MFGYFLGEWNNDECHGQGMICKNGITLYGSFELGSLSGKAVVTFPNGNRILGHFRKNLL